jgi:predicted phage terminase large subunit-like protein
MPEAPEKQTAVVDRGLEDQVATEALLALRARKDASKRVFDPRLGATRDEATARVEQIRNDLGAYGEFVHGHTPARHHRLWIDLIHGLTSGTLTETAIHLGLLPETERGTFRNKLLLLAPPASAKSSWCSIALPTWYLGKYPDRTVLFFTSSDPAAVGFGNTIKILLEQAKEHKEIWPDQAGRPDKRRGWSSDGLYLKATPMSGQSPAYRAVGWGASVMGQRANLLIIDDPMNQENAESGIEQAKAKRYYDMTLGPRLQPGSGAALAVMTRWAEGDLASHFIEKAEQGGDWLVVPLPMVAEAGDPLGRKPGELLWPEQYPRSFVEMQRKSMGSAAFSCVYNTSVAQMAGDVFSDERWFKPLPANFADIRESLLVIQGVDVAFSEKDRACFTVVLTLGLNVATGDAYIINVLRDRMTVGQTEDALVSQILTFRPGVTGIEDTAFKHAVTAELVANVRRRVYANIVAVPPREMVKGRSDKVARARLPAQRAEAGLLYADKQAHWWPAFISEVLAFPRGRTNDQVDALSLAMYMPLRLRVQDHRPKPFTFNPH